MPGPLAGTDTPPSPGTVAVDWPQGDDLSLLKVGRDQDRAAVFPSVSAFADPSWGDGLPAIAGPTVALRVDADCGPLGTLTLVGHVAEGLLLRDPPPGEPAEETFAVRLPIERLLALYDRRVDDPVLSMVAPPATFQASLEGLLYMAGVIERWVEPLRSWVDPDTVDAWSRLLVRARRTSGNPDAPPVDVTGPRTVEVG